MSPTDAEREGPFALHLDTEPAYGFVKSVSGGSLHVDTAVRPGPGTIMLRKRPVSRAYESFYVQTGMGAPLSVFKWIDATLEHGLATRSGEVHACDRAGKSLGVNHFFDAHIREITFPRMDANSAEDAFLSISFHPSGVRQLMGTGGEIPAKRPRPKRKLTRGRFSLELTGMPEVRCWGVGKIKWALSLTEDQAKSGQLPTTDQIEWTDVSNATLHFVAGPENAKFFRWCDDAMKGAAAATEIDGRLCYLSTDGHAMAELELLGCFPVRLSTLVPQANDPDVGGFEVELCVNSLRFNIIP